MHLTRFTEYSLRVLIYLAPSQERLATIGEIAKAYDVSHQHLVKVVHNLAKHGYVTTVRGKGGGIRLAKPLESVNVGELVRKTEANLDVVDCAGTYCPIREGCRLLTIFEEARDSFLGVLDRYTLSFLVSNKRELNRLFH
ncbi:MAG: Rrf2 family transcriptional regulator [Alphaproteobacteria bacterium]|jgi:Rrf2 family nitric oxide-sensitive transcriptional repressor|nr:Rrf2 family transcriptional regulator [Rhodospirillaceae bacterium]MDP6031525.1 Rrf2 family transcriptional regulator [Alphaproteobacteria bacterium]MDP7183193.1 Rrf2 family transcriptional regulator [Alphaproteobacteria bacterium]MDP7190596.1 Rrf2 family transcriptional regulator [Alphaproteobacteria bacterium]HJO88592.1 Rrf2 family transcriptional regulator [Alphaproteobacteria bacterium]|tara:strand:+ start:163 stop:582 length:420 start_codon:yes stop_codon:yes gene_type:complete